MVSLLVPRYRDSPIPGFDQVATQRRMERYAIDHKSYVALYAETQVWRGIWTLP